MKQYDYLIVGAGLFGAVFAHEARKAGKRCLVIDRRGHIAGNVYTEQVEGINVHRYGAHIFHTNSREVWNYVGQFAEFNHVLRICQDNNRTALLDKYYPKYAEYSKKMGY